MTDTLRIEILDRLSEITDPVKKRDLVSLGMINGLQINDGNVVFAIEIDPNRQAEMGVLRKQVLKIIEEIKGVNSLSVVLTAEKPKSRAIAPDVANIIVVSSAKGGVGKSTVSINLAHALRKQGLRVGLLDGDIYGPSQPMMTGITDKPKMTEDKYILPPLHHDMPVMSIGFLISNNDTALVWRGPMVQKALFQMLCDVKWGTLDVLIIDLPPGTGDVQLTLAQKAPLAGAIVVSTPQDIALIDAVKGISMFEKLSIPILGLVENMSTFSCPNCSHESHIFGHGGAKAEAKKRNIPYLGGIPLDIDIRTCADNGTPVVLEHPESPSAKAFLDIAHNLSEILLQKAA